jgi:hypothetical protein
LLCQNIKKFCRHGKFGTNDTAVNTAAFILSVGGCLAGRSVNRCEETEGGGRFKIGGQAGGLTPDHSIFSELFMSASQSLDVQGRNLVRVPGVWDIAVCWLFICQSAA